MGHVAPDEHRADRRVEPRGDQDREQVVGLLAQGRGLDLQGQRVQVHHAVERIGRLGRHPLLDRAEVIADVQVARWLDPREDAHHVILGVDRASTGSGNLAP